MTEELKKQMAYSDEILDIIDHKDDYTRSDLQGVVEALTSKIMKGQ